MSETYTSPRYLTCAETAKLLRAALKQGFPGVTFSVRSSTYAGGASIRIGWTDGPTSGDVDKIAKLYNGATFDGMIDLKSYHTSIMRDENGDGQEVHFGADYVFTNREISEEWKAEIFAVFSRTIGRECAVDDWNNQVPLAVDRTTGELYHMVEAETEYVQDIFHRYTQTRTR